MVSNFEVKFLDHPNSNDLDESLTAFEMQLVAGKIHPAARQGLIGNDELAFTDPFPKIESHDTYLYGVLATPTDIEDGKSKFFNIQFLINETMALVILLGPMDGKIKINRSDALFAKIRETAQNSKNPEDDSQQEPGNVFVKISRVIVDDLQLLVSKLNRATNKEMDRIESVLFDETYQSLSTDTSETYKRIRDLKFEILSIAPTINETQNVFKAIADQTVKIRPPFTSNNMDSAPFSKEHRIWIDGLLMRTRSLKAQRFGLEQEVRILYERLESLENRRQTAAQMRFAAVASILLLPALIVGYFGQEFQINPWTGSTVSWKASALVLLVITAVQFVYFKKKKWF